MSGTSLSNWRWRCAIALLLLLAVWSTQTAAGELTQRLIDDARDGQLEEFEFFTAALIAGGVTDQCELEGWLDVYAERREALLDALPSSAAPPLVESLHDGLHERLLSGQYETTASDLRLTIAKGDFNCLTSLAIYLDLCQATDLPVQIWLARGHVFLRASSDEGFIDIEPAAPSWQSQTISRRGSLRQITPVELLGKFFYNRGVELLKEQQFFEGIELLRISLDFDPADSDARANLVAGFNNWAVDYLRTGRYDDAADLIQQGLFFDPAFAPLIANEHLVRMKRAGR